MVTIEYSGSPPRLTATGHARSARKGSDLVCAAVSALMQTLEAALSEENIPAAAERGSGRMSVEAEDGPRSRLIFKTVAAGLRLVESAYPENVKMNEERT